MQTADFLARVVPQAGNFLTIGWTSKGRGFNHRSYPMVNGPGEAAGMIDWLVKQGCDVYHALAAFNLGEARPNKQGRTDYYAKRDHPNVQLIRVLVLDADVTRPGDGKSNTFPDRRSAVAWVTDFCTTISLPMPNLAVNSGYGIHFYWVLEDALTLSAWEPLARSFKAAALAHHWPCDTGSTVDAARILRPPNTVNMKTGSPVPVNVYPAFTAGDLPNQLVELALAPWVHLGQATGTHGGQGATISQLGPRPSHIPPGQGAGLNAAAHVGIDQRAYSFKAIASKCAQAKLTLDNQGANESYTLWYLGGLTLLAFCSEDGDSYVHEISKADARYNAANVDAHYARAKQEIATKALGAPLCASYDSARPGVCGGCPFQGKINSPISLGTDDGDLPIRYRRHGAGMLAAIELFVGSGEKGSWIPILGGDVYAPRLEELDAGGHRVTFTYELAGKKFTVGANDLDMGLPQSVLQLLARQGISADRHNAGLIGDFLVAWINQLRNQRAENIVPLKPFGWNVDRKGGARVGVAIAGDHYRRDGSIERVSGADNEIASLYRPVGDLTEWRRAAAFFEGSYRADLQTLIATSFASPLIALTGDIKGMSWNFWSQESGIGKTFALRLAQSVWGNYSAVQSMRDTPNAVMKLMSEPHILVRLWDELRVRKDEEEHFVELIYSIPQGKERARMMPNTSLRPVGMWECMLVFTSNRSMMEYLVAHNDTTDSALQRLFEVHLPKLQTTFDPNAGNLISLIDMNYGHAGRAYLQWIVTHLDEVEAQLKTIRTALVNSLGIQQEERFFAAAMTTTLVGAWAARKAGLFDFDIRGIDRCLTASLLAMRSARSDRTLVTAVGLDIEEVLSRFVYDSADVRVYTESLVGQGNVKTRVLLHPRNNTVRVHIAHVPGLMRVHKSFFTDWLHRNSLPAASVINEMIKAFGATLGRGSLGGGTQYSAPQARVVDIPLTGALAHYLDASHNQTSSPLPKAPGASLAGNQPTI